VCGLETPVDPNPFAFSSEPSASGGIGGGVGARGCVGPLGPLLGPLGTPPLASNGCGVASLDPPPSDPPPFECLLPFECVEPPLRSIPGPGVAAGVGLFDPPL